MAKYYTYYTDHPDIVATVHPTQASADAKGRESGLTAWTGVASNEAVEPGWYRDTTTGVVSRLKTVSDADQRTEIRAAAAEHGNICLDMMKPGWVLNDGGSSFVAAPNEDGSPSRWRNTYYWIVSPVACIDAAVDATWTLAECKGLLAAYQRMVPAREERIAFWYRNHGDSAWRAYVAVGQQGAASGHVRAFFNAARHNYDNVFTSDAGTSLQWNGGSNTLDVTMPEHSTPTSLIA